jgi:cell division protein FtsB
MNVRRVLMVGTLGVVVVVFWVGIVGFLRELGQLKSQHRQAQTQLEQLERENGKVGRDISYFSEPHNLEKILRARLNYKRPGEEMIIVVPPRQ